MPENLAEISDTDFALWRHHPVTKLFLAFLADFGDGVEKAVLAEWKAGSLTLADEQHKRGYLEATRQMADVSLESIQAFYGHSPERENAAETAEDTAS